jgi:nucleotide-binding universal stress UspA family protein
LIAAAQACGADLLVIARHRGDSLARAWIGGVAQKVIGLAECPVLVHVSHPTAKRDRP